MTEETITIGNKQVIYSTHLFCQENEAALVKFMSNGIALAVEFKFVRAEEISGPKIESDGLRDGVFHLRLTNWPEGPISAVTPFPWKLAKNSKYQISLAGGGYKIGKIYSFSVQFMIELI